MRAPILSGQPISTVAVVHGEKSGFMAATLTDGMRAVSIPISVDSGAGGFILPNDRVDVILSRREKNGDQSNGSDSVRSEIILSNIRVLAIDQTPREKDGQNTVLGKTATLELKPAQAETLARARQSGTISLALRSLADASAVSSDDDMHKRDSVNIVRYGVSTTTTTRQ